MRDQAVTFTRPSPFITAQGTPVIHDGKQVGDLLQAWVDGNLVRWKGALPPPMITWEDTPDDPLVPQFDPPPSSLVARGALADLVHAQDDAPVDGDARVGLLDRRGDTPAVRRPPLAGAFPLGPALRAHITLGERG